LKEKDRMEPEIKRNPAFMVVGMKYRGKNENNEIPQLWNEFGPRMNEIKHITGPGYGIMDNYDEETGEFDYVAGFEVDSEADVPEGMVCIHIPEQTYAIFPATLPTLRQIFHYIYGKWLPKSSHRRTDGPEFELYDKTFNPEDETSEMYIYIPVAEK
jgi:AraC family transcriptional regulator